MQFSDSTKAHHSLIEDRLQELIPEVDGPHAPLFEATKYALFAPAKRLRPLLLLATLSDFQLPLTWGLDPACALEMVHTYSLIHDDLPCMDNDDLRRGKPSLHKVYGPGQALLAGDFLLTHAFYVIASALTLDPVCKLKLITLLSKRAGGNGMIGGQVVDLLSEGVLIDQERLTFIHRHKTASLLGACLEFGGIIGNLDKVQCKALKRCGFTLGLGFQMLDDILDEASEQDILGKPIGSDRGNDKSTSLTVYGQKKAIKETRTLFTQASHLAKNWPHIRYLIDQCQAKLPNSL